MSKTNKLCRICLTTNEEHQITDSSCYADFFLRIMNTQINQALWLCVWCKTILKRTIALIKLASESETILNSEHQKLDSLSFQNSHNTMSYTTVIHLDIQPECIANDHIMVINVNDDNNETSNEVLHNINDVHLQNELDNLNKFEIDNPLEIEEMSIINYVKTFQNINEKQLDYEIENSVKGKQKCLKLDEFKFELKYLNMEEQLKEIEVKKMNSKNMKFVCDMCGVGFLTMDYYEEHQTRHTKAAGPYKCPVCSLHFKKKLVHSQHLLAHRRQFSCILCGRQINKWSNCKAHRLKCGVPIVYVKCDVCSKVFSDEHTLKIHNKVHNSSKKFSCVSCDQRFSTKQKLQVHVRTHTGSKPFSCEQCSKSFATNSNLRAHYSVHATESKHYCVECDSYYKTDKSLKRHLKESLRHARERNCISTGA